MALELSNRTSNLIKEINVEANIVLKIEDDAFPELFGMVGVTRALRIGDFDIGDGSKIGGITEDENSRDWLQKKGTTNNIRQKVDTDKPGGSSSINTFTANLIDKDNELTNIFSPGVRVPDILGLRATVYWAAQGGAHPEDSVPVFRGIISTIHFGAGNVSIIIDSPEQLKRQDLLPKVTSVTTAAIDGIVTTIPVDTTSGYLTAQDALTSYIKIEDEIIQVGGITDTSYTGCTRGVLGSVAVAHDDEVDTESFYRITEDSPIDLTLKLIMSGIGTFGDAIGSRINQVDDLTFIQNAILIKQEDFAKNNGLVIGDTCTITGATNASNNIIDREILEFEDAVDGQIIRLSGTDMVTEGSGWSISFKSKYDVLNFGCAIDPFHVDIERFEDLKDLVGTQQPDFDYYAKDTINAREFIDTEVLWPSGMFGVFRQGRISVSANLPPLSTLNTKTLTADNVKKAEGIKIKRTFKTMFYNATVFKFEEFALDDRFLASRIIQSADSTNRINIGNKPLTIEAKGIRDTPVNRNKLDVIARRILDRYQYGAEHLEVSTNFKTGFTIEVGDSVVLQGDTLNLSDSVSGTREYIPRVLECVNKSLSLVNGDVKLSLIDSVFDANARYGVISPASKLGSGSTVSSIVLKTSFGTITGVPESRKWDDYIGQRIQVRSPDFAFQEIVTIVEVDPSDDNKLNIQPDLSSAPLENYVIESPNYDDTDARTDSFYKSQHVVPSKEVEITSGASSTQFNVAVADAGDIVVDNTVLVHSADYSDEIEVQVLGKTGTLITVEDMGFTPDSTYGLIPIRFLDGAFTYRAF